MTLGNPKALVTTTYTIGEIPPQRVWHGDVMSFIVSPPKEIHDPQFLLSLDPKPLGSIQIDASGIFKYAPDLNDKFDFSLTIAVTSVNNQAEPISQTIVISPMAHLPQEFDAINYKRPLPPEEDVLIFSETFSDDAESFNNQESKTRIVDISAETIIFDRNNDQSHQLCSRLSHDIAFTNADLKELRLYADKVIVRSELWFPQTHVTIFARILRFEDQQGQPAAAIKTTPLGYTLAAKNADPNDTTDDLNLGGGGGYPGLGAGTISLRIQSLETDLTNKRFILQGGPGQEGGHGLPGKPGESMPAVLMGMPQVDNELLNEFTKGAVYTEISNGTSSVPSSGTKAWPGDGYNALPPGPAGGGGWYGSIDTTVDIPESLVNQSMGINGKIQAAVKGGPPGEPNPAYWIITYPKQVPPEQMILAKNIQVAGLDGEMTWYIGPMGDGTPPTITRLPDSGYKWIHPFALKAHINFLRRAFLSGDLDYVRAALDPYLSAFASSDAIPDEFASDIEQARFELLTMHHRLLSNLDYFGNPLGWVPFQSLEVWMRAFGNEVEAAIPLLYLSAYLATVAVANSSDLDTIRGMQKALESDTTDKISAFKEASSLIGPLQQEAEILTRDIEQARAQISARQNELLAKASWDMEHQNQFARTALTLSKICDAIPIGQPYFSSVGKFWQTLSQFDPSHPLAAAGDVGDVIGAFNDDNFKQSAKSLEATISGLEPSNSSDRADYVKHLGEASKTLIPGFKRMISAVQAQQVPQSEIDAELQRLQSTDQLYQAETSEVSALLARKQLFASRLAQALDAYTGLPTQIQANLGSLNTLQNDLNQKVARVSHGTLTYFATLRQAQEERLLRYQYLMAKAYEYRMLEPYVGDYGLKEVIDSVMQMVQGTSPKDEASLTGVYSSIATVFRQEVQKITARALFDLKSLTFDSSVELHAGLSHADLQNLNSNGEVQIDLGEMLLTTPDQENLRIADVSIITDSKNLPELSVAYTQPPGVNTAQLYLSFYHSGTSEVFYGGKLYRFVHSSTGTSNPFVWGAVMDLIDGSVNAEKFSASGLSLLRSFLETASAPPDLSFLDALSKPGANSTIRVVKALSPPGTVAEISNLRLSFGVSFFRGNLDYKRLIVKVEDGLMPYIKCAQMDLNKRSDGRGSFTRVFQHGLSVTLEAPPTYGSMAFSQWTDGSSRVIGTETIQSISLDSEKEVRAVYKNIH
jgi:hypothetical protein